jgi:4'-phosphopantetheinyl transferase
VLATAYQTHIGVPVNAVVLPAPAPGIMLWLCDLDRAGADAAALSKVLSDHETARADRFGTPLLRARWIAGRATLRSLLGRAIGLDPAELRLKRGIRGRPELDGEYDIDFNVSHTGDTALIAICSDATRGTRIGIDIEREARRVNADGLARKFLSERERVEMARLDADGRRSRFLRLWTCKEAMSKATGDALSAPFRDLDVSLDRHPQLLAGPHPYTPSAWTLSFADVPPGFLATLAIWRP